MVQRTKRKVMAKYKIVLPFDKSVGRLVWIPKGGNPVDMPGFIGKAWALLQEERRRLVKTAEYERSKGKFKLKYLSDGKVHGLR